MEQLNYLSLNDFLNKTSMGEICPSAPIHISNMIGDRIHQVSYLDHCNALCQKHDTNLLKLLSVINQKVNNDMVLRLGRSPIFKAKVMQVMNERGYNTSDESPEDVFDCPQDCYDISDLQRALGVKKNLDDTFISLENLMDNSRDVDTDDIHRNLSALKDDYHSCESDLQSELQSITATCDAYEPKYGPVLYTLARIPSSEYLKESMEGDGGKMKKLVRRNAERYLGNGNVCLGVILLSDMMKAELEKCSRDSQEAIGDIRNKMEGVNVILGRIPAPGLTFVEKIMKGFLGSSDDDSDDNDSDDDDSAEEELEKMKNLIQSDNEEEQEQESEPSPAPPEVVLGEQKSDEESDNVDDEESQQDNSEGFTLDLKSPKKGGGLSFF